MARKERRREVPATRSSRPATVRPAASRLREGSLRATFTDESQYTHVRGDLIRIGLIAFSLFAILVLLRVVTSVLGMLP